MLSHSLTDQEKRALLELLGYIATSDREVSHSERRYIVSISHHLNESAEGVFEVDEGQSLDSIANNFESDSSRRIALAQVVKLGYVDDSYRQDEWEAIREIGEVMNVSDDEIDAIEDWVADGMDWQARGRELLNLDPGTDVAF